MLLNHIRKVSRIRPYSSSSKESIRELFKQADPIEKIFVGLLISSGIGGIIGVFQGTSVGITEVRQQDYQTSFFDAPLVLCYTIFGCITGMFAGFMVPFTGPMYLYLKYTEKK